MWEKIPYVPNTEQQKSNKEVNKQTNVVQRLFSSLLSLTLFFMYFLAVAECKITGLTGVSGIMIRETAETLGIITQDNKFKGNFFLLD